MTTRSINLGSGRVDSPLAGWLSLDRYAWPVSVVGELRKLPFPADSFAQVHCAHVIEHVPYATVPAVLSEIRRIMTPNGILYISGPDMDRTRGIGSKEWMHYTQRGGDILPGWKHHWTCGVRVLRRLLIDAGLVPTWCSGVPTGWPPNTHSWPLDLEARFLCRRDDFPWPQSFPVANFRVQL